MIPARIEPILEETRPLAERFAADGKRLYLVGGIVRDLLLGRDFAGDAEVDIDLTTDARPADTKRLVSGWADAVWTQGERFGTIGCQKGERRFEITTHRAEVYEPDSRKPDVVYADAIEADLSRRDFTINAMALALTEPELIDPFGGAADLAAGVLRTPLPPQESFSDDPLRMMRAARFIAKYGVTPDPALIEAVREMRERLEIVSAERIRDELDKLLVVDDPSPGLWFLVDTGLIDEFLPELPAMRLEQDPIHRHKDVLAHTIAVVAKTRPERIVRLAALLHDVGKPKTRSIGDAGVSFHHHEVVGARMARDRMRTLKYSNDDVERVSKLVYLHLRFHTYDMGWTDSAVRRFVRDAGDELSELIELTRCDCTTRNARKAQMLSDRMDELEARIVELGAEEELKAMRPDIDGQQVMDHLGIGPGRDVGQALAFLLEARLDEGPLGEEEAYRRLDTWWAERVTDIPTRDSSIPSRLGVTARFPDDRLELDLTPTSPVLHHGVVRASVVSFIIDAVAGVSVDGDAGVWTLTTDMSVRMRPVPAPRMATAVNTILRQGRRSVTSVVEVTTDEGEHLASGAIGFAHIPRKPGDPPKPIVGPQVAGRVFQNHDPLTRPLREEAGIEVLDAAEGVVQVEVVPELLNPAGTLQGAMVALVAEAAAEDLVATRFESPVVVTDLDLRYLAKTGAGPVRTRSRLLGDGPDAAIQVELVDTSTDQITTLVYARAVPVP